MVFSTIKLYVQEEKRKLAEKVAKMRQKPRLLILQVGSRDDSNRYVGGKVRDCQEVGIECTVKRFNDGVAAGDIKWFLRCEQWKYDGVILQMPANVDGDVQMVLDEIGLSKDVDGLKPGSPCKPCTARGIVDWLKVEMGVQNFRGKVVGVLGQGRLSGRPLAELTMDEKATVISMNSSSDWAQQKYDVFVSCAGRAGLVKTMPAPLCVDVGINLDENGKLCGDFDKAVYEMDDGWVTPVPGGVGLLTRLALLKNVVERAETAYKNAHGGEDEWIG